MTPKEKAKYIVYAMLENVKAVDQYNLQLGSMNLYSAKQCALIAVDEIMEFMKMDDEYTETASNANSKWVNYWLEVKQEIEKL
jgi:predicted RNase H-like nuclease (RuvC/YqgF family)